MKNLNIKLYIKTIAEPNRLKILELLKDGEKCACDIHPKLKISQNLNSHHLKVLKDLGLLKSKKEGTTIVYSRDEGVIKNYQQELTKKIL